MLFRKSIFLCLFLISACDDLNPSSRDDRPVVTAGTSGPDVGQVAPDFALFDTLNAPVSLSAELSGTTGVVLYFTMWCPICDSHMSHMRTQTMPDFPSVKFYFIDYVSGSVHISRLAQISNGYSGVDVLVDDVLHVMNLYKATMGTTVVIDTAGVVQMNEDYKDGVKLYAVLSSLP